MLKLVLIAGYTKTSYVNILREYFPKKEVVVGCVYQRPPSTEKKKLYLKQFDVLFNLNNQEDLDNLQKQKKSVALITCTQERDMGAYIKALKLTDFISDVQEQLYTTAINKRAFKEQLQLKHPELVPEVHVLDESLMQKLTKLNYPQVIKPSGLTGSTLVKIVHSPKELEEHVATFGKDMHEIAQENFGKGVEIISEEYISGPQYSVNVYIDKNQEITFCPIVRVVTPQEMGSDDSYSALQYTTDEIEQDTYEKLRAAVQSVVHHFDLHSTSAHFDSVLQDNQWKFFEIGLRIGGKRQELYQLSNGMNHFQNDIRNRLHQPIQIPKQKKSVCIVQKASEKIGILKSVSYTRNVTKESPPLIREDKMAKVGTKVAPLSSGGGTVSRFFVHGENQSEVVEESKLLFQSIKLHVY